MQAMDRNMPEPLSDVNQPTATSTAGDNTPETGGGELGAEPASTQQPQTDDKSLTDFVNDKLGEGSTTDVESEAKLDSEIESNKGKESSPGEEKKTKDGDKKEDVTAEEEPIVEGQPVPYDRFKQVVDEREQVRKQVAEELMPQVQNWQRVVSECQKRQITAEQFEKMVHIQGLLNMDPEKALPELEKIVDQLRGFTGGKLPEDLQAKVDSGRMELEDATEVARLRAQQQFGERKTKHDQQVQSERAAAELRKQCQTESQNWITAKQGQDPDFKAKANDKEPDGLFEFVFTKFDSLLHKTDARGQYVNPCQTPQELVALMERAYKEVKPTWVSRLTPKSPTRKILSSNGSSRVSTKTSIEEAPTMAEAISIALNQRK